MLPAIKTTNVAKGAGDHCLQCVSLARPPVCPFNMGRLDLATVVHDFAFGTDESLVPVIYVSFYLYQIG